MEDGPNEQWAPLREVGPDLCFRWWRGQDLNLRPSGYEISDRNLIPYHCVPDSALLQGFRRALYSRRAIAYTPVPRRTVEGTVETTTPCGAGPRTVARRDDAVSGGRRTRREVKRITGETDLRVRRGHRYQRGG